MDQLLRWCKNQLCIVEYVVDTCNMFATPRVHSWDINARGVLHVYIRHSCYTVGSHAVFTGCTQYMLGATYYTWEYTCVLEYINVLTYLRVLSLVLAA